MIVVIIGAIGTGLYLFTQTHKDLSGTDPDFQMTAGELISEFTTDEEAANAKYVDKIVEVSGEVYSLDFGNDSIVTVILMPPGEFSGVVCTFDNVKEREELDIKVGDQVTMRGKCSGMLMDVLLNNAVIIE